MRDRKALRMEARGQLLELDLLIHVEDVAKRRYRLCEVGVFMTQTRGSSVCGSLAYLRTSLLSNFAIGLARAASPTSRHEHPQRVLSLLR